MAKCSVIVTISEHFRVVLDFWKIPRMSRLHYAQADVYYTIYTSCRIACKMLEEEEEEGGVSSPYFDFVESCLRHKSEMVIYEAAHAIVNMKRTTSRQE